MVNNIINHRNKLSIALLVVCAAAVALADPPALANNIEQDDGKCGRVRQKDMLLADTLEASLRLVYQSFTTLDYVTFGNLLAPTATMCVRARFNFGCYVGKDQVLGYVRLIDTSNTELLRLHSMTAFSPVYVDIEKRAVHAISEWKFFSYPTASNHTLYMHDTLTFDCNNKITDYLSWGDSAEWTAANIPPQSTYNVTRICLGHDGLVGIQGACTGANQQYVDDAACISSLTSKPDEVDAPFSRGDSKGCRDWHLGLARFAPDLHCSHVGPTGGGKCVTVGYDPL